MSISDTFLSATNQIASVCVIQVGSLGRDFLTLGNHTIFVLTARPEIMFVKRKVSDVWLRERHADSLTHTKHLQTDCGITEAH